MEQWSIFSNVINYLQYSKNPKDFSAMSIKPTNKNKINVEEKRERKVDSHHRDTKVLGQRY